MAALTPILIAVLGFVIIAGLGFVFAGGDGSGARTARRTQLIAERGRSDKPRAAGRIQAHDPGQRRKQIIQSLKEQDRQQRKVSMSLSSRLLQAGLKISVKTFWITSAVLGVIGLLVPILFRLNPLIGLGVAFAALFGRVQPMVFGETELHPVVHLRLPDEPRIIEPPK